MDSILLNSSLHLFPTTLCETLVNQLINGAIGTAAQRAAVIRILYQIEPEIMVQQLLHSRIRTTGYAVVNHVISNVADELALAHTGSNVSKRIVAANAAPIDPVLQANASIT